MGQIHQHLVFFNHIALNHQQYFLEYIPHLRDHFLFPAVVQDGLYKAPHNRDVPLICEINQTS